MKKTIYTFIISIYLTIAACIMVHAQAGSVDPTFGPDGKVVTSIGNSDDRAFSVAIQTDGKIVIAGYSTNTSANTDFALIRYNTDGTLDNTFGTGGIVTTDFGSSNEYGYSVAIQADNKIVLAGFIYNGSDPDFALARYNNDGTLDNTFNSIGKVTTDLGGTKDYGYSVAIQTDGKIVVAGYNNNGNVLNNDFALARYNTNGTLDVTFDTDGKVDTDFASSIDYGRSVVIQNDGKIVVAGYSGIPPINNYDFALARYSSGGGLDNTFGSGGKVTTDISSGDKCYSVCLQTDGKIIVAGSDARDFVMIRYNSNGSLDNTFGSGGIVSTNIEGVDYCESVALQSDGKIILAGYSTNIYNNVDFTLARYNIDGTLDNTFGSNGKVITDFGGSNETALSVAIQTDGNIVLAGYIWDTPTLDNFAIVRYYGSATVGLNGNKVEESIINVFPNPFTNDLVIKGTKREGEIIILDMRGKEFLWQKALDVETKINTGSLLPGFYLLKYNDGNKTVNIKIIKL